jgi:low affinity Fe/Cu permease
MTFSKAFTKFATLVARTTGKPITFVLCVTTILVWALSGPIFHFSDTWQLVINTGTTIITFLQVFLIQNTQNRDGAAIQAKLDELIRVSAAQNRYMGIEELTEEELSELRACEGNSDKANKLEKALDAANQAEQSANERAQDAAKEAKPKFS